MIHIILSKNINIIRTQLPDYPIICRRRIYLKQFFTLTRLYNTNTAVSDLHLDHSASRHSEPHAYIRAFSKYAV